MHFKVQILLGKLFQQIPLSVLKLGIATPCTTQNSNTLQELLITFMQRCSNLPKKLSLLHRRHPSAVCGGSVNIDKSVRKLQKCGKDEGIQTVRAVNDRMIINVNSSREYLNITGHIRQQMNVWAEKMSQLPHKTSLQGGGRSISIAESQIKVSAFRKKHNRLPRCCSELCDTG